MYALFVVKPWKAPAWAPLPQPVTAGTRLMNAGL
jgi:hypothetical protein